MMMIMMCALCRPACFIHLCLSPYLQVVCESAFLEGQTDVSGYGYEGK